MQNWLSDYIMNLEETDVPKSQKKRKQRTQPKSLSNKMNSEDTDVKSQKKEKQGTKPKSNQELGEATDWLNRRNRDRYDLFLARLFEEKASYPTRLGVGVRVTPWLRFS